MVEVNGGNMVDLEEFYNNLVEYLKSLVIDTLLI